MENLTPEVFIFGLSVTLLVVCAWVGSALGAARGRGFFGFMVGLLLGPIGWLFVLLLPREVRRCHACMEVVHPKAQKCRCCGCELISAPVSNPFRRRVI